MNSADIPHPSDGEMQKEKIIPDLFRLTIADGIE
jgi:hypothetical protein